MTAHDFFNLADDPCFHQAATIPLDGVDNAAVSGGHLAGRVEQPVAALRPRHDGYGADIQPAVQDEAGEAHNAVFRSNGGELNLAERRFHCPCRVSGLPGSTAQRTLRGYLPPHREPSRWGPVGFPLCSASAARL